MLESLANRGRALIGRAAATQAAAHIRSVDELNPYGPLLASREMRIRESDSNLANYNPESGTIDPKHINQIAMFVLFGFIGAVFVVGGIWFFFWAKNGGFTYHENDWEDYVSTVLRRKGPNGTILSNVTKSTKLGGGSVYHDYEYANRHDEERTEITGLSGSTISGITAGASDLAARAERKRKIERRKREKKAAKNKKRSGSANGEENSLIEEVEAEADAHLREYRAEKPARVGGLNREADGSEWEGSTIPSESNVSSSLLDHQQPAPMNSPEKKKAPGIRKVYSTADRNKRSEEERLKAEARRMSRQNRAAAAAAASSTPGLRGGASDISGVTSSTMTATTTTTNTMSSNSDGLRRSYTSQRASGVPRSRSQRRSRPDNSDLARSAITEAEEPRTRAPAVEASEVGSSTISGTTAQTDSSTGTKSYYHPIPELQARSRSQKRESQPPITRDPSRRPRESRERGESSTRRRESRDREGAGASRRRESRDREGSSARRSSQSRPRTHQDEKAAREERRKSRASGYRRGQQSDYDDVD